MPTISKFFGIAIRMYYDNHAPPHFHAYYGDHAAIVEIETLRNRQATTLVVVEHNPFLAVLLQQDLDDGSLILDDFLLLVMDPPRDNRQH